ncbi:MAG: hypothetical protein GKS07_00785 [Nitrosopumilus sp.]|nr:MAG: hypothetical protein GKS07_00785 [Nitrosopumilus sp.]
MDVVNHACGVNFLFHGVLRESLSTNLITISIYHIQMTVEKNEIDNLIDNMITGGDEFVNNLKTVLPDTWSESMTMFQESNVANLKKIKEFLNK